MITKADRGEPLSVREAGTQNEHVASQLQPHHLSNDEIKIL